MTVTERLSYIQRCAAHDGILRRSGPWLSKVSWGDVQMNFYGGKGAPPLTTALHSHARGFHSRVLRGTMINVYGRKSQKPWKTNGDMRAFRIDRNDEAATYAYEGRTNMCLQGIEVIPAGQEYSMNSVTVHCAVTVAPTITLVELKTGLPPVPAFLLLPDGEDPPTSTPLVDADADWSHVDEMLDLLEVL